MSIDRAAIMKAKRRCRYLIEANGRDSFGTSFQFFAGAQGWNGAAQEIAAMFRRVPGDAEYSVQEIDLEDGVVSDVTEQIMPDAEASFHEGADAFVRKTSAKLPHDPNREHRVGRDQSGDWMSGRAA